jgi:hypothetical protein
MRVSFFTPANAPISTVAELPPMTNASFPQERPIFSIPRSRIDCFPFMIQARSALAKTKSVVKNILAGWCPSIPFSPRKGTCASVSLKNGDDQFCLLDEHQTEDHDSTGPTIYFPLANLRSNFDQTCEPNRTDTRFAVRYKGHACSTVATTTEPSSSSRPDCTRPTASGLVFPPGSAARVFTRTRTTTRRILDRQPMERRLRKSNSSFRVFVAVH